MTDKEKFSSVFDMLEYGSFEDYVMLYMCRYRDEFSLSRVYDFIKKLERTMLEPKIVSAAELKFVANERAGYIKKYLEGKMFKTEEEAKAYVDCQIDNAQAIIKKCKEV